MSATPAASRWLFSFPVDMAAFVAPAVVAGLLLAVAAAQGWLAEDTPEWTWVGAVLLVDVAHVYATAFRVYFVPAEVMRRPWLYALTPAIAYGLGLALYSESELWFWRCLAYLAVFHFVRQQYGWVALYRAKRGERDLGGKWLDGAAIYVATLYPLLYWHAHLPRRFAWFVADDFVPLSPWCVALGAAAFWSILALYAARSLYRALASGFWNPGKDIVVATTALCWYGGIVALNSDFAFTVTNVLIHGVPYMVLVYWVNVRAPRTQESQDARIPLSRRARRVLVFVATLWFLAYCEEWAWDRGVWHERGWLFGSGWTLGISKTFLAPLLAVPQITHYVLDGFIWRRKSNPDLNW